VDARSVLRELVTEYEGEHTTVLAAFDLLATLYLDEGDAERARTVLEECREHFRSVAEASDGPEAGLLAKVDKLKAWKLLARAEADAR
jgi:CTP:molybdopterin cytidylyltransferase MocA